MSFLENFQNRKVIKTEVPCQWGSLVILLLLNTVERQSIISQIRQLSCSNMGFPSGLQFVLHQESSVSKSFMAMNQSNTLVPRHTGFEMQRLVWGEKSNSDKPVYRGKLSLVQQAYTRSHSAFKPHLNEILVCVPCVVGVGMYLLWSRGKSREVKGPQKANENKPKENQTLWVLLFLSRLSP